MRPSPKTCRPDPGAWRARGGPILRVGLLAGACAFAAGRGEAVAQIRPFPSFDWELVDADHPATAELALSTLSGQRAGLAGTEGTLWELGAYRLLWHDRRVVVEAVGTVVRLLDEDHVLSPPAPGTDPPDGERRVDTGGHSLATTILLHGPAAPSTAGIRFGVTLPTEDNAVGLGTDRTHFFGTLVGRVSLGALRGEGEVGIAILGTRSESREQVDPILYSARVVLPRERGSLSLQAIGRYDTRSGPDLRGTEDLGEMRLGLRVGRARWVGLSGIVGWERFSPDWGVALAAGAHF